MSNLGRNDPCPCGSGKKYKHCHLNQSAGMSLSVRLLMISGAVILAICLVLLIGSIRNFEGTGGNRVWSEEHQHWHYL